MLAALSLALLVLVLVPAGAAAQIDVPVDPPVLVPGAPAEEQPAPGDPPPACDPELQACGEPCAPDVDEGCAPECGEVVCKTPDGRDADDDREDSGAPSGAPAGGGGRQPAHTLTAGSGGSPTVFLVASSGAPAARAQQSQLPETGAESSHVALAGLLLLVAGLRLRGVTRGASA